MVTTALLFPYCCFPTMATWNQPTLSNLVEREGARGRLQEVAHGGGSSRVKGHRQERGRKEEYTPSTSRPDMQANLLLAKPASLQLEREGKNCP